MPILVFPAPGSETAKQNLDKFSCFDVNFGLSGINKNILNWSENFNESVWKKLNNQLLITKQVDFLDLYLNDSDLDTSLFLINNKESTDTSSFYIRSSSVALSQTINVDPDTAYTVSFVASSIFNGNLNSRIRCNSTNSNIISFVSFTTNSNLRITQSFITSSSCYSVDFFLVDYGTQPGTFFISQPQIETGNLFTEYFPTLNFSIDSRSVSPKNTSSSLSLYEDTLYDWDPVASVTGTNLFYYPVIESYIYDSDLLISSRLTNTSLKILYHTVLPSPYLPYSMIKLKNFNQIIGQYQILSSENDRIVIAADFLDFSTGMNIIPVSGHLNDEKRLRNLFNNNTLKNYNYWNRYYLANYYPFSLTTIKLNLYDNIGKHINFDLKNFIPSVKLDLLHKSVSNKLYQVSKHNIFNKITTFQSDQLLSLFLDKQVWKRFFSIKDNLKNRNFIKLYNITFINYDISSNTFIKIQPLKYSLHDKNYSLKISNFAKTNPLMTRSISQGKTILTNWLLKFSYISPISKILSSTIVANSQTFNSQIIQNILTTRPSNPNVAQRFIIAELLNFFYPKPGMTVSQVSNKSMLANISVYSDIMSGPPAKVIGTDIFTNSILDNYIYDSDIMTYSESQKNTQTFSFSTLLQEPIPAVFFNGQSSVLETEPSDFFMTMNSGTIEMNIMPDGNRKQNQVILSIYRNELLEFLNLSDLKADGLDYITEFFGDYVVFIFKSNGTFTVLNNVNYKNFYDVEILLVGGGGGGGGDYTGANGGGGGGSVVHMTRFPLEVVKVYNIKVGNGGQGGAGTAGGDGETTEAFGAIASGGGGGGAYPTGNGRGGFVGSTGGAAANNIGGTVNVSELSFFLTSRLAPESMGKVYNGNRGGSLTAVRTGTSTRGAGGGGAGGPALNTNPNTNSSAINYGTEGSGGPGIPINILNRTCFFGGGGGGGGHQTTAGNGGFGGGGGGGAYALTTGVYNGFNGFASYSDFQIKNIDSTAVTRNATIIGTPGSPLSGGGGGGAGGGIGNAGGGSGGSGCVIIKIQYKKNSDQYRPR